MKIRVLHQLKCDYSNNFELNLNIIIMKNVFLILAVVFIVYNGNCQRNYIEVKSSSEFYNAQHDYFKRVTFKVGGGILIPQGALYNYFGMSPLIELSLDFPVTQKKSLELALQFIIPNQKESFTYVTGQETINANASFMFNPMLRFKKNISNNENAQLHLGAGLGTSVIKTDIRNPFYTGNNQEEEKYEMASAFLISPSLDYVLKFKNNEELTFSFALNYSPYKIEGALKENIGAISLTPRILYSF